MVYDIKFLHHYRETLHLMAKNKALAKPNTDLVTQSNALIESSYRMSIPAKRVMLMLLGEIHPCQKDVTTKLRIQAADYAARTGTDIKRSYSDIKRGCRELMRTIITMRNPSAKTTEECVVVSWMKYHDNDGWLEATFTQWISPHIHHLKNIGYTTIEINEAIKFRRFHTVRFFELLMQRQKTNEKFITIEDLRRSLQIEKNQYPRFTDLRRFVIEPSIKEIERKSDWVISWEPVKTGRKITSLMCIFKNPAQPDVISKKARLQKSTPLPKTPEEYAKLHPRKTHGKTTKEVIDMMQRDNRNV